MAALYVKTPADASGMGWEGRRKKDEGRSRLALLRLIFPLDIHSAAMYVGGMIEKELVAASTEPLVLSILSKGESYGYELIQEVKRLSGDKIEWTDGMLYPVLHRMEANGWIKARWVEMENGRKRKYYSIKKDGQQALKEKREQWTALNSVLSGLWKGQNV
jgi:DNA-binding PadR family transcriptional regulator